MPSEGEEAASTASSTEDVTDRVMSILSRELGLADPSALLVCTDVFEGSGGGAERMCAEMGVPLLGKVPMDPQLGQAAERGRAVFSAGDQGGKLPVCVNALMSIVDGVLSGAAAAL